MNYSFDPHDTCKDCGQPLTYAGEWPGLDLPSRPYYVCHPCVQLAHNRAMSDIAAGRCFDVDDLLAELRGGPKALMECEKPQPPTEDRTP